MFFCAFPSCHLLCFYFSVSSSLRFCHQNWWWIWFFIFFFAFSFVPVALCVCMCKCSGPQFKKMKDDRIRRNKHGNIDSDPVTIAFFSLLLLTFVAFPCLHSAEHFRNVSLPPFLSRWKLTFLFIIQHTKPFVSRFFFSSPILFMDVQCYHYRAYRMMVWKCESRQHFRWFNVQKETHHDFITPLGKINSIWLVRSVFFHSFEKTEMKIQA